jgi:two-component system NtrC family response regulator
MNDGKFRILIVDDDPDCRVALARALAAEADVVATAGDASEAMDLFRKEHHQLVLTDLRLPGKASGLDLVKQVKHERPETLILVVTAYGSVDSAVEAMRHGSHDYIGKPLDLDMLRLQVRNACEHYRLIEENRRLRDRLAAAAECTEILGQGSGICQVRALIRQVADTDVTVLIRGESGTGKELVARAIHDLSVRRDRPFVAGNIAALPDTLIEAELFGYEKGAFSGADRKKPGWFEMAQGGSLFLDEIGELPVKTQVDLLRVLEQREVRRLGGEQVVSLDVRLIAATHREIEALISKGRFREDLYYRLNVVPLWVPPLRKRHDDIPALVDHFLQQAQRRHQKQPKQVAGAAMRVLCDHPWPGNVRQLRNCMERLVVTVDGPTIHAEDLPDEIRTPPRVGGIVSLEAAVREAERTAIGAALSQCNGNRQRAADLLGISVRTLHYKLNRYELQ